MPSFGEIFSHVYRNGGYTPATLAIFSLLIIAYLGLVEVASPLVAAGETVLMDVWFFWGGIAHP